MYTSFLHARWGALRIALWAWPAAVLVACGGGGGTGNDGAAVQARAQTLTFDVTPSMTLSTAQGIASGSAQVSATASSGLPVTYTSVTPDVCAVDPRTGAVTVNAPVTANTTQGCVIAADQYGDAVYAPVRQTLRIGINLDPTQAILFADAPALSLFSMATVSAAASSGLAVSYSSDTPSVCTVDAATGVVQALAAGACTVVAHQGGDAHFDAAPDLSQTLVVTVPEGYTVPGQPTGVTATYGDTPNSVVLNIGATDSGGSPITRYDVVSSPAGITASGAGASITVPCGGSCNGYAFSVVAVNAVGRSAPSAAAQVLTAYDVVATFYEPATQPNNTIFTGSFTFNATTGTVSALRGTLTESMTGGSNSLTGGASSTGSHYGDVPMTLVNLTHQLSAQPVTLGGVPGLLVTTFALDTTNTFITSFGGDGWSPDAGVDVGGVYYGFPKALNPYSGGVGNAYAMVFVNTANPEGSWTLSANPAQVNRLAYADCTAGGMMGAVCMTGTAVAGYTGADTGSVGTMGGYPLSLAVTRRP